jgi:hypothetical protein
MREITYKQQPGVTQEQALPVLAEVYRLALEPCRERRQRVAVRAPTLERRNATDDDTPPLHTTEGARHDLT